MHIQQRKYSFQNLYKRNSRRVGKFQLYFSPPAGAENFRVTVVGGGGGGAGGTGGRFRKVLSVKDNGAYVVTAPRDGTYYIALQGGGGAGGGMACGTPEILIMSHQ